jgi:hypothetical protein
MRFRDQSLITWYRCSDAQGNNAIEVAVSRFNEPKREYILTEGDISYYILWQKFRRSIFDAWRGHL